MKQTGSGAILSRSVSFCPILSKQEEFSFLERRIDRFAEAFGFLPVLSENLLLFLLPHTSGVIFEI